MTARERSALNAFYDRVMHLDIEKALRCVIDDNRVRGCWWRGRAFHPFRCSPWRKQANAQNGSRRTVRIFSIETGRLHVFFVAAVGPFNEPRWILGPPDKYTPAKRFVGRKTDNGTGHLLQAQEF